MLSAIDNPVTQFIEQFKEGLICAVSRRSQGNMSLSYGDTRCSLDNRKAFLGGLGVDSRSLVCLKQTHSNRVKFVSYEDKGRGALTYEDAIADTDALITNKTDLPLAVFTADCLPVFLYSLDARVIGLAHAGWRGTKEDISGKTVELMRKEFNVNPKSLRAFFGPAIRQCCYEVGEEFSGLFPGGLIRRGRERYLDLVSVNKSQLLAQGLDDTNIFDSKICASCQNKEYFSYRKEGKECGRMVSVMMLK